MELFHGSKNKFKKFSYDFIREHGTSEGIGFYFTDKKEIADHYGADGYTYVIDFQGKKELSGTERIISDSDLKKYLMALNEKREILSNWGDVNWEGIDSVLSSAIENFEYEDNDLDIICGICNACGDFETPLKTLYDTLGYDYTSTVADWGGKQKIYVAFVECFTIKNIIEN